MNDDAVREIARTCFDRPVLVEAGAGTGKTTALIARLATYCLGPGWERAARDDDAATTAAAVFGGVVAITFTEAATAEMASRFSRALAELAARRAVRAIPEPDAATAERAAALLDAVDRLQVSTIHGFCSRLLSSHPIEAGLHPSYRVDADGSLLDEIVQEAIVDFMTEVFGGGSDGEARAALLQLSAEGIGSAEIASALTTLAGQAVPVDAIAADPFGDGAADALLDRLREAISALLRTIGVVLKGQTERPKDPNRLYESLRGLWSSVRTLSGPDGLLEAVVLAEALPSGDLDIVKRFARGHFDRNETGFFWGERRDEVARLARQLQLRLDQLRFMEPRVLMAGRAVLVPLLTRVRGAMARRGVVTYDELLRRARDLLADHPAVRLRLRGALTQLLVDEFQDTDRLQCDLVRLLAMGPGPCPGLFVVGDPKQSIYGWRNADLSAYAAFVASVREEGGHVLPLADNRRSLTPILDEVERLIEPSMLPEEGYQPAFQRLRPTRGDAPPPPSPWAPVEYWNSSEIVGGAAAGTQREDATRREAQSIAADLRALRASGVLPDWDRAAILFRSTTDLGPYLEALRDAAVPYAIERDRNYFRKREIVEADAAVRCVLEPLDALALLAVLRAPWVGVPDAALLPLWDRQFPARVADLHGEDGLPALFALVDGAAAETARSGAEGLSRVAGWEISLKSALRAIATLRAGYRDWPADRFVAALREAFPMEAIGAGRYLGHYRLANLERFFHDLGDALIQAEGDPQRVLRALRSGIAGRREAEEARPTGGELRAVRVMTIHKAKGLDFDHVYVPQLDRGRDPVRSDRGRSAAQWLGARWEYTIFGARTPGWSAVEEDADRVERCERLRLLYVATTRACDRLVLLGVLPEPEPEDRRPPPPTVATARSLLDFVLARRGGSPAPSGIWEAGGRAELDGACFRILAAATPPRFAPFEPEAALPLPADWREREARRAEQLDAAARTMARPWSARASAHGDDAYVAPSARRAAVPPGSGFERGSEPRGGTDGDRPTAEGRDAATADPGFATALGTAVHYAIERLDRERPSADGAARDLRRSLRGSGLDDAAQAAAFERGERLLDGFLRGRLGARFRELRVVARELPLLAQPAPGDLPVGFVAGAIDLLAEDPRTGDLIVVDYKTDTVRDEAAMRLRAEIYRGQATRYANAVRDGLELSSLPRAELWFLALDAVCEIDVSATPVAAPTPS